MSKILNRLEELGLTLPAAPNPVAAYVNAVRTGNLVFVSGGLPIDGERRVTGKVGADIGVEEAKEAARMVVLNRLAVLLAELGNLDKITRIVALNGFVSCTPDFTGHPQVMNGASELLVEIFGEAGKHSRTAVGVPSLPFDVSVELNLVVEVA
jgi:enamine deaminase RidA (YjgF/YER057c/UK114 family)